MLTLQNDILQLELDATQGKFNIIPIDQNLPAMIGAQVYLSFTKNRKPAALCLNEWDGGEEKSEWIDLPQHGKTEVISFWANANKGSLACRLTFGLVQDYPLAIWKAEVINQGKEAILMNTIDLLVLDPAKGGVIRWPQSGRAEDLGFFSNGWQSWSPTRWYAGNEKMQGSRLGGLQLPMIKNAGTPTPKKAGQFTSDFFAVLGDRAARTGFVIGSLSQNNHFTSIYTNYIENAMLRMWANGDGARLDPMEKMTTDWAVYNPILLDHRDPLDKYLEAVARENHISVPTESPVGWCSWYHFYTKISEPIIRDNLKAIVDQQESLPIQLVQVDDGFESQIGDWFTFKPEFPQGVAPIAAEIQKEGLLPGLWLAPFILHPDAEVIKQHPDWVLRKKNGKPVNCGFVWGKLTTALDLTIPEALDYACRVVKTASAEWGYPYLKLDFLYAAAVDCQYHDPTLTRAQVLRRGMEAIREAVGPDVTLLGCGAPFGAMLGLVEAMRIGADVSGDWAPKFNGIGAFISNEPAMPCARNSIRNILTRASLHQHWWINDPDCLLIRPDTHLSLDEVQSLASVIALTGGSLLVSDDLPQLPADRRQIAECLLPVMGERARVLDWFDAGMPAKLRLDLVNETGEWHVLAKFNWQDHPADLSISSAEYLLPEGQFHVSEFWRKSSVQVAEGESFVVEKVPPHGCIVTAWRRMETGQPVYLGSDLHISQGIEVAEWKPGQSELDVTLRLPRKTKGSVHLFIPSKIKAVFINGSPVDIKANSMGMITLPIDVDGFAHLKLVNE